MARPTPYANHDESYTSITPEGVAGVRIEDTNMAGYHRTTIRLDSATFAFEADDDYVATKIGTFPEGRILVLGATQSVAISVSGSGGIGATDSLKYSVGTSATTDTTLDGTEVNLLPEDANALVASAKTVGNALSASAHIDGTTTALPIYLNFALASVTSDDTITATGTIDIVWVDLGDY